MTGAGDLTAYALTSNAWTYEIKADGTVEIRKYTGRERHLTVPGLIDGIAVTSIGDSAFSGNRGLRSISIPEGVTEIGNNAFFNNSELRWVTLPDSLEHIGYSAFFNCIRLTHILIPRNVTYIGFEAFGGTSNLMTVYFRSPAPPAIGTSNMPAPAQGNAFWGMPAGARAIVPNGAGANYTVNALTGKWNNLRVYTEEQFGIDHDNVSRRTYDWPVEVPANCLNGNPRPGFIINLSNETLTVPADYVIRSFSTNGGLRWRPVRQTEMFNKANFPRLLNRGMTLSLSDSAINPVTRQPFDNLNVVNFPLIRERPRTPRFNVNYALMADATGVTAGRWVLAAPALLRERTDETIFTGNIEIGLSMGAETVDSRGFGLMQTDQNGDPGGMPVLTFREFGYRVVRTIYLVRLPPRRAPEAGTPGFTYTPASRPSRLRISSELRPPRYRIDQRQQLLRLNGNDTIYRGSERHLSENLLAPMPGPFPVPPNLTALPFYSSWYNPLNTRVNASTAGLEGGLTVWRAAAIRFPASAKQVLITPPGADIDEEPEVTARINDTLISGYITVPFTAPYPQFTVTLVNTGFVDMDAGDDVSVWFANRPSGLSARVVGDVPEGATTVTVEMYGTIDSILWSPWNQTMSLSVPGTAIVGGTPPTTITNINARYSITSRTATFAAGRAVMCGRVHHPLATCGAANHTADENAHRLTINITGDTFNATAVAALPNLNSWFPNMPNGMNAQAAGPVTPTSITVQFSGTPTVTSSGNITATIPSAVLQGDALPVSQRTDARWRIWNATAGLTPNMQVGGIRVPEDPWALSVNFIGFSTSTSITGASIVLNNLPNAGLAVSTTSNSGSGVMFIIIGTASMAVDETTSIQIPGSLIHGFGTWPDLLIEVPEIRFIINP
jgi:hypothetical protein